MTRKQELYIMLIKAGFVFIRNQQSLCLNPWWRVPPWRWRKRGRGSYLVAQFLHNIPDLVFESEFSKRDIRFLNSAKAFFEQAEPSSFMYGTFFSPVRQIFNLVPENLKNQLSWAGPTLPVMTAEQQASANEFLLDAVKVNNNIETLRNAIVGGPDLNVRDKDGRTALMIANDLGKTDYVQELRNAGAEE